jgi:hypothetical protein
MAAAGVASEKGAALLAAVRKNDVEQIKALAGGSDLADDLSILAVDFT